MARPSPDPAGDLTQSVPAPGSVTTGLLPLAPEPPAGPPVLPGPPDHEAAGLLGADLRPVAGPALAAVFSRLATDPRMLWWVRRAILSAVAGGAVSALTDWRFGITAALLVAVADTLLRVRTTPAVPAPARVGSAQRKTRRRLSRLSPPGYLTLHCRAIPGTTAVINHLVVGPAGVFTISSQRWDRRLPVRATGGGELFHGPYGQADRLQQAAWEAAQASQLIGAELGEPVPVRPAMVIYGPKVPWIVVRIAGVDVFSGRRLRRYLRRETAASRARRLSERQIELIYAAAARVLPPGR